MVTQNAVEGSMNRYISLLIRFQFVLQESGTMLVEINKLNKRQTDKEKCLVGFFVSSLVCLFYSTLLNPPIHT